MYDRYTYRGKREDNGEWVYGFYYSFPPITRIRHWLGVLKYYGDADIDPATLGQCTGIPAAKSYRGDKPEDLIMFEGDQIKVGVNWGMPYLYYYCGIIRFGRYRHNDAAQDYECGDYGFYIEWHDKSEQLLRNDLMYWVDLIEIIGNIHDNPEMAGGNV